ncbi:MAG: hypothetical protein KC776_16815 [Myxococcales bacterium]|nr:hypothetical protein [Myxococcales bacterium]MCB9575527.1 hypothetical protein [Polyangiaceae bacterium]
MTTASVALPQPAAPAQRGRSWAEFLLTGGVTLVLFPLSWLAQRAFGLDAPELFVGFVAFHAAHVINDPHFSVSYVLFYRRARERALGSVFSPVQRARYVFAGVVVPVVLAGWAGASIAKGSAPALGMLIQLMFLLVGWHYVKQGFGVLTVLSARRGSTFTRVERTVALFHCYAAWAFAWASPFDPGREVEEKGVVYTTVAHPAGLLEITGVLFLGSALALAIVLIQKRRREGRWPPLAPLTGFLVTAWLWTVFSSMDPLMIYVIPALHSLQYLYFVHLLEKNRARSEEGPPAFGRPVGVRLGLLAVTAIGLGLLLFHLMPGFFDERLVLTGASHELDDLGATPYFAAFFAVVNIHHYFMDTVLWRRENPDTRFLRD